MRQEFEEWFLRLDADHREMDLLSTRGDGDYFYTTTQALWKQWQRIEELEAKLNPEKLARKIGAIDYGQGDFFCLDFGGAGDNGEWLIELIRQALEVSDG